MELILCEHLKEEAVKVGGAALCLKCAITAVTMEMEELIERVRNIEAELKRLIEP